ncbi:MAG TPA: alcohol dehydrogenase catalytic domain-containing protein [Actinomycetota bacterium]|nr:alcohol dehydrogenase catalytic domain-containing protein [Actinomycetota bacterium]
MRAAVFADVGRLSLEDRPEPTPAPDEVLLEVQACGICGTDVQILSVPPRHPARPGVILGHEFVGIVRGRGSAVRGLDPGERVAVLTDVPCRSCRWCRRGLAAHCEDLRSLGIFEDGGLAPAVAVPASACYPIADHVPSEIACLAEPIACALQGLRRVSLTPGDAAAVLGGGPMGLIFAALLRAGGAGSVLVVEPSERRRHLAGLLGTSHAIDPSAEEPASAIRERTDGLGADLVVDAVGAQLETALAAVRPGGQVLLFGMDQRAVTSVRQFDLTARAVRVVGTFAGTSSFADATRVLETGLVDWTPLVTHVLPLEGIRDGLELVRSRVGLKVVISLSLSDDPRA